MKRRLTPFGKAVKKRLIDLNMTQVEFCGKYGIPKNRMTELVTGLREWPRYETIVREVLDIQETA